MAHYAKLGANNKVIAVHVVADKDCKNADGIEDEEVGRQFLERIHSWPLWKKTSYNTFNGKHKNGGTPLRGNYAGIGMDYDEDNDLFLPKNCRSNANRFSIMEFRKNFYEIIRKKYNEFVIQMNSI